ncbi:hypothetical protein BDB00DRAFT_801164 [Zychaea mexicana]|uniref:uncharacterized protein n=1 Tax=Zychaea mexicana TaxID=64656 RepID=UPI0022FF4374|nr:uncharacterized protein BDB00DRAFT_801164 [Zychaea mexicana]KAI9498109.1 hypothetical protein BDB00DRAFT_801164 [Zychaea mexicana]
MSDYCRYCHAQDRIRSPDPECFNSGSKGHIPIACPQPLNSYPRKAPKTNHPTASSSSREKKVQGGSNHSDHKATTRAQTKNKLLETRKDLRLMVKVPKHRKPWRSSNMERN